MTSTAGPLWPDHLLDLDEWDALDEEMTRRAELVDGVLVMAPSPSGRHQRLGRRLATAIEDQLGPRAVVTSDVDVVVDPGPPPTVRRPDVVVLRPGIDDRVHRFHPADVLAVFEVLSPGTRRTDRVAKLAEYAEAGIAHYGLVEIGPPTTLTEFVLRGDAYDRIAEHRGHADLALGATIDLAALL